VKRFRCFISILFQLYFNCVGTVTHLPICPDAGTHVRSLSRGPSLAGRYTDGVLGARLEVGEAVSTSRSRERDAFGRRETVNDLPRYGESGHVGRVAVDGPFQQTCGVRQVIRLVKKKICVHTVRSAGAREPF